MPEKIHEKKSKIKIKKELKSMQKKNAVLFLFPEAF